MGPALTKLPAFEATVRTPDGKPAAGAKVTVVLSGRFVTLRNGVDQTTEVMHRCETDQSGGFQFEPRNERFELVITHPAGYALFRPVPHSRHRLITLDPWTRVEGTLRAGNRPIPDAIVSIDRGGHDFGRAVEHMGLFVSEIAKTDADGRFVFARALPGSGTVICRLPQRPGLREANLRSTQSIETRFPVGGSVRLDFGKGCRTVVGTLRAPPSLKMRPEWRLATIELQGESRGRQARGFKGPAEADGSFRIDNVPPGRWALVIDYINYSRENSWRLYLLHHFSVTEPLDESSSVPLDLRVLMLEAK